MTTLPAVDRTHPPTERPPTDVDLRDVASVVLAVVAVVGARLSRLVENREKTLRNPKPAEAEALR